MNIFIDNDSRLTKKEMDESFINHLFLPPYLPSCADNDFLIQGKHENEHRLLECMNTYLNTSLLANVTDALLVFRCLSDCIRQWSVLQNPQYISVSNLQSTIAQLPPGSCLPLYFHTQNAAIIIEMDKNNNDQPLISAWQVLLPSVEITSSCVPHLSCFPITRYRLHDRSQLTSTAHCELLMDFMHNTVEYSKSSKASREVDEIRDVPESHYICQWWIQHFDRITMEKTSDTLTKFTKKHRDQIRWTNALLPFRRSGLWMTIKGVLHTILAKHLGSLGSIVYKLLITDFLTDVIYTRQTSIDILVHCIRKIVRRLNKIEDLLLPLDTSDVVEWLKHKKHDIESKINQIIPKPDWQNTIRANEERNSSLPMINFEFHPPEIYQHLCLELKTYLNEQSTNAASTNLSAMDNHDESAYVNQVDYIPSIGVLTTEFNYTISVAITRLEIWIDSCLERWINRAIVPPNERNRFDVLLGFFEEYQNTALNYCWSEKGPTDPIAYSRFILASLTIIRSMHQNLCRDSRFERLKLHCIDIPNLIGLFEYLSLPNREDMVRARSLHDYFTLVNGQTYPDLLTNITSVDAFGVYYAAQSSTMDDSIRRIRTQAQCDKQQKIREVQDAKQRHQQLIISIRDCSCGCTYKYGYRDTCNKCYTHQQADRIRAQIFECPMPLERESALAVIFELQMPTEIRCYRDIIWQFINRSKPHPSHNMYEWLSVPPHSSKLGPFCTEPNNYKVKLVSSTKSTTQSHYSNPSIAYTPVEGFLFENSLEVTISPTNPINFEDERRILTPQLDHPDYKQLQFTIDTTQFVQNHVISQLSNCPQRMRATQYVEFGSFRSGHRLQWWNLLAVLEMDSLSIGEESVAILIIHSILQYGPFTTIQNKFSNPWCPESHQQLLEDDFVDEFVSRLDRHLDDCELNWQSELVLTVITMITTRIFTICNSTQENKVIDLVMKCRKVGGKWIDLISNSIQTVPSSDFDEIEKLRLKLVNVGVSCILTFSTDQDRTKCLLSTNEHMISLLKAVTTVHDNIVLSTNQSNMSTFMRNIMKFSERVLVLVQPTVAILLQTTSYQSLNDFATIYWAVIRSKGCMNEQWKKRKVDIYDGWYDCQYESRHISIDCIRGTFLVDGMTVGFLPKNITSNELFIRVFGNHIFEVQAAQSPNTYITKHSYHAQRVLYEFHCDHQINRLIINERYTISDDVLQLIPHSCFESELPDTFVSSHSHWWNTKLRQLEFRPVHFQNAKFLDDKLYVLTLDTGYITTTETENVQILINQASGFFQNLFRHYFIRLDDQPYVYMMRDDSSQPGVIIIHIHLSRLGIAFEYNATTNIITSREYSDMCVDKIQWLGTLTGLTSGLLLSPLPINDYRLEYYPYRKLIVPFGKVCSAETLSIEHQTVTIQRSSSTPYLHQYFVFILNDRLRILQSNDSPAGWLYLALLHALTSHPLPDQYTGMTGMERAFQLLNSAGCASDQPFDGLSLNILAQIASVSPKVNYYPGHLTCMVKIDWNPSGIPYSMQHFGYYLITKHLIDGSQHLSFMFPSSISNKIPELFNRKLTNEILLRKLYWDYRDSYNPTARLSSHMETDIRPTFYDGSYQPPPEYCSHVTNYREVRLADDLYNNKDVDLKDFSIQNWLPLSQWLADENQLKNHWIGFLKLADRLKREAAGNNTSDIDRYVRLLDFLHYISEKCQIKPFYLQMLETVLNTSTISLASVTFPPFIEYKNIEEIFVTRERINFAGYLTVYEQDRIVSEVEDCFRRACNYEDRYQLGTSGEKIQINQLLTSWQNNRQLRSFLEIVQNLLRTVRIENFTTKVSYYPPTFQCELIEDHHQIQVKSSGKSIDYKLIENAQLRFDHTYSGHFSKPTVSIQTSKRQNVFPQGIFSSICDQDNPVSELTNYFKNQLNESWKKLLPDEQTRQEDPSVEEIIALLDQLRKESTCSWSELVKSITSSNEQLMQIGLVLRIIPTTLIGLFQRNITTQVLTIAQRTLLGGILVCWTLEQHLERALHFVVHLKQEDFRKELSNTPHANWIPSEHVSWLMLELEMNITIRETQIQVARHMMQPTITTEGLTEQSLVMQMNMGEGKTSVILPMLAVGLCSSYSSLVRIIVLKSLFPTNYQSLRYKLGGLLNRRVFPFGCRRDLNFNDAQINQISRRLEKGLHNCDVILTSPEDILSFDLLMIDKCRRNEYAAGRSMLILQRWLKTYVRDVLDESDEILHVKYQLIYTVGGQQQVDGGAERWKTIQSVLQLVKKHASDISIEFVKEVCYKSSERKSAFPQFRLQSPRPFAALSEKVADDWMNQRSYRYDDKQLILSFLLKTNSSVDELLDRFSPHDIQLFLIVRGLLSSEVLLIALKKRHRVNYGVNPNLSFNRLLAVPFRAKDVAADRTEFGHPDVALVLTHLTYYYSGLNDSQLTQCFDRLSDEESDPASIYDQWMLYEEDADIPTSIKQWKGINLKDYQQRTQYLFPTLRYNMLVVNYFLNHFVFPREAKQFPHKLIASAWDLSSSARSQIITGFSGTNDTQLLLPIHIRQHDLPELQQTDAIVVNNLLQPENDCHQFLPINITSKEILDQIRNDKESINVIIDVGALFIDGTNRDIAVEWLNRSDKTKIDYAVYFDSDSIVVCDRQSHDHPFVTSPASERLDRCIFYLDEIHTRGTDFKFPTGFRAAVTLGNGLTKDRFVQACMRMRKLGHGHSLTFWSSHEVHQQMITLKTKSTHEQINDQISVTDILRWVYENTVQSTWDGLHHWAVQSLSFQRKISAFRNVDWRNNQQEFTNTMMEELANDCLEPEIIELIRMYGASKTLQTVLEIHFARYEQTNHHLSADIQEAVMKKLTEYGGTKQRLSQLLDEEQQRELEQELEEERQLARPPPVQPGQYILHEEIKRLCDMRCATMDFTQFPNVFRRLTYAFTDTTFIDDCQPKSWSSQLWISTEFQRVIATKGESLNPFLRPPRWLVLYRNEKIIYVSAFEANWLIDRLQANKSPITTLRLLLPRTKRIQSIFVDTQALTIPSTISLPNDAAVFTIPKEWLIQLFIFNGTLYFGTMDEQTTYCQCLGLCPKPRTKTEEEAFEKGWIGIDGYVSSAKYRRYLQIAQAQFLSNPLKFVKEILENRNNSHTPITSHVGSIILNSTKIYLDNTENKNV